MQTLGKFIDSCEHKSGFKSSEYRPTWIQFLNESIREFARSQPWPALEDFVDITADSKFFTLPHYIDTVISVFNVTHKHRIDREGDWDRNSPTIEADNTGGNVIAYDRVGYVALSKDPVGYVWFKSGHASDTQTISFSGLISNSGASGALEKTFASSSVYASGTSPVTLTTLFTKFMSLSRSTESAGDFYFYDAGDSNRLIGFIGKDEISSAFQRLQLQYVPTSPQTLRVRFRYKIPRLVSEDSAPPPGVSDDFIVNYALSLHLSEQEQHAKAQAQEAKALRVLEKEANRDENFNEPHSRMCPLIDTSPDDWTR